MFCSLLLLLLPLCVSTDQFGSLISMEGGLFHSVTVANEYNKVLGDTSRHLRIIHSNLVLHNHAFFLQVPLPLLFT